MIFYSLLFYYNLYYSIYNLFIEKIKYKTNNYYFNKSENIYKSVFFLINEYFLLIYFLEIFITIFYIFDIKTNVLYYLCKKYFYNKNF